MNLIKITFLKLMICVLGIPCLAQEEPVYDLCIYGGTSAGVIAAYSASKAGKSVILVEPGRMLGGLSSGGLGKTDIGNKYVIRGLALDFYRKLGKHYGAFEQWMFEPHVAENVFKWYMDHCDAQVIYGHILKEVNKPAETIQEIQLQSIARLGKPSLSVKAKVYMDCSYEGDLLAMAGASYHVGREDNKLYGETLNGVQLAERHQFPDGVDPYVVEGDSSSGLIWGIRDGELLPNGTGDTKVQAYNFRITLTDVPTNRITITKPDNYDPSRYELLRRLKEVQPWKDLDDVFIWTLMPNGKTDINNRGGFSTDMIGANWDYPEAEHTRRQDIIKAHEEYTKGLLYFVGNDPSVPAFIREKMQKWGYPKDEYVDNSHWSPQLYIREARRMVGELVMTQRHCQGREVVDDVVGYAAYTMDSHNCDRVVVNGMVKNEGNVEVGGFPPFPIAYRSIVPKRHEVANLLVPVCLSASHIAFGSIRMEPVFMVLGQSAAIAACLAIDKGIPVQSVDANEINAVFKDDPKGDGRLPDRLITSEDTAFVQFTGAWRKGQSRGYGRSYLEAYSETGVNKARFNAPNLQPGRYNVYTYFPWSREAADLFACKVFDRQCNTEKQFDLSSDGMKERLYNAWLAVGEFTVHAGKDDPYVELSTTGKEGTLAANAVLFVPQDDQD